MTQPLRVLVVTNMFPTTQEPSFGVFVRDQVDDLRALGDDVEVLAFDGRRRRTAYIGAAWQLRARLKERAYDVVHAHYGLTGAVAATQRRVPTATTFHGGDTGYIAWQRRVSAVVARHTVPIVVERGAIARLGITDAAVVPCGVDLEEFSIGDRRAARRRLGWDESAPTVILPGARANVRKGAALFDDTLRVVGRTRADVVPQSLEGFDRDGVRDALTAADVVLMTSLWEGSPVAVKEALACGTPVVSVPVGDVAEVLGNLPPCAVRPREAGALGAAVLAALAGADREALRGRAALYARPLVATRLHAVLAAAAVRAG